MSAFQRVELAHAPRTPTCTERCCGSVTSLQVPPSFPRVRNFLRWLGGTAAASLGVVAEVFLVFFQGQGSAAFGEADCRRRHHGQDWVFVEQNLEAPGVSLVGSLTWVWWCRSPMWWRLLNKFHTFPTSSRSSYLVTWTLLLRARRAGRWRRTWQLAHATPG